MTAPVVRTHLPTRAAVMAAAQCGEGQAAVAARLRVVVRLPHDDLCVQLLVLALLFHTCA